MKATVALVLALVAGYPITASARAPAMDNAQRQAIVEKTIQLVRDNYVYPDRARLVEAELRRNARAGKYNADSTLDGFLDELNRDMQAAGNDKHLRVSNNPRVVAELMQETRDSSATSPEFLRMLQENNFRLKAAEMLDGNIGYFKFDNFVELRFVRDAFVGAMNFLHGSSALIIDLRDNGGGASETSDLLLSYFLPDGARVGEWWNRTTNRTTVTAVTRPPEVKPMLDTPLYILVSNRTASAAEAVAYTLQQFKRAVIVGSTTKGMANAGQLFPVDERIYVMVPTILQKSAVSGTNWEGVGVHPDVAIGPDLALDAAMARALEALAERKDDKRERYGLLFMAEEYASLLSPEAPPAGLLEACVGEYEGGRKVAMEGGALFFVQGVTHHAMRYMGDHVFTVEGRHDYRLRFPLEGGTVRRLEVLWFDDTSDVYQRTDQGNPATAR